jgi:hypothetical protein
MNEKSKDRPPAFPAELLNRPRPRGVLNAEEFANRIAGGLTKQLAIERSGRLDAERVLAMAFESYLGLLELTLGLQLHIQESIGLIDAGKPKSARAALDAAVVMLDGVDFSALAEPDEQAG